MYIMVKDDYGNDELIMLNSINRIERHDDIRCMIVFMTGACRSYPSSVNEIKIKIDDVFMDRVAD